LPAIHQLRNPAMRGYCYLLSSKKRGTLYCGVTSDLPSRIWEHREGLVEGFTSRYGVKRLVWYEEFPWVIDAGSSPAMTTRFLASLAKSRPLQAETLRQARHGERREAVMAKPAEVGLEEGP
jgi:hypothetical protein